MAETELGGLRIARGILFKVGSHRGVPWLNRARQIVRQEFHLLRQPPAHDGVIAFQSECEGLPAIHLLANVRRHQLAQFIPVGRFAELPLESRAQPFNHAGRHVDSSRRGFGLLRLLAGGVQREERHAEQGEVEQRFLEQLFHG
jgi:hypothetical protein